MKTFNTDFSGTFFMTSASHEFAFVMSDMSVSCGFVVS